MPKIKYKFDQIGQTARVMINDMMSDDVIRRMHADEARRQKVRAQRHNRDILGSDLRVTTFVDGRKGADEDSVRLRGKIIYEFELLDPIFKFIHQLLVDTSPVGQSSDPRPGHPGLYSRSHVFMVGNMQVDLDENVPLDAPEYSFVNTQPYARKIEYPRLQSKKAPEGVYESVAATADMRFSNIADVYYNYRSVAFGSIAEWANVTKLPTRRSRRRREEWLRRQPAVIIRPRY
jgi:hypothetical protein